MNINSDGIDLDDNDMRPTWEDYNRLEENYDNLKHTCTYLQAVSAELLHALETLMGHNCKEENENFNEPCPVGERARAAIARAKGAAVFIYD